MTWTPGVPLKVGDVVEERTRLVGAAGKRGRAGGPGKVFVEVEKEFRSLRGLALVDRRSWVFRPPAGVEGHVKAAGAALGSGAAGGGWQSSAEDVEGVNGTGT